MEHLIRFRSRTDELDENEFHQFIMKLIESKGRNILMNSLFEHFKQSPKSITPITNIATKIIDSRDISPEWEVSYDCIDKPPSSLIGECGSFLSFKDYLNFSTSNRNIYIGCYSPPRLYKLDLLPADTSKLKPLSILNNVRKFSIGKHHHCDRILCDSTAFCNLLKNCHHVEYLSLHSIKLTNYDELNDTANIQKWLPNLKGFCSTDCKKPITGNIIPALCDQLEILTVDGVNSEDLINQQFPKLEEIELFPTRRIITAHSFMNIRSLKRIHLYDDVMILSIIDNVIGKQLALESVSLYTAKSMSLSAVLKKSAIAISSNNQRQSKALNMAFGCYRIDDMDWNDILSSTMQLVKALESSTLEIFKVRMYGSPPRDLIDESNMKLFENGIENVKQDYFIQYQMDELDEAGSYSFFNSWFELAISNSKNEMDNNDFDVFHFHDELDEYNL